MSSQVSDRPLEYADAPTLLLGVGNDILCDDGIGPRVVGALKDKVDPRKFICSYGPMDTLALADMLRSHRRIVLVDAVKSGRLPPGTVCGYDDLLHAPVKHITALHDMSLPETLALLQALEGGPQPDITVIGIEIVDDTTISDRLSAELEQCFDRIVNDVMQLLARL